MLPIANEILRRMHRNDVNNQLKNKRKFIRTSFSLETLSEERFIELFRLNKAIFYRLENELQPFITEPKYNNRVSVRQKLLVALRFYATGCYQRAVGEDLNLGLSQTSVHRYVHEVTEAIDHNLTEIYIRFPQTPNEINEQKRRFMDGYNFPGVIGAIDGTQIAILKPTHEEHNFINRKGFYSINTQIVASADLRILSLNANYPGASHDAFIWRNSYMKTFMWDLYNNCVRGTWLIGDSGYPLEPVLMTPFLNPAEDSPQSRYNTAHVRARNCVERCIGLLKARFRCLLRERVARYNPQFVGKLINSCAVLHNLCISNGIDFVEPIVANDDININRHEHFQENVLNEGRQVRNNLVNRYFANN